MALSAGRVVGCDWLEELTLEAPLFLTEGGGVAVQVRVEGSGERGEREVSVHARPQGGDQGGGWTCHARGVLAKAVTRPAEQLDAWPPEGAEPIDLASLYDRVAEVGFTYGPAFQGLTAAWRQGESLWLEVSLAPEQAPEAARFVVHPALLDAALQGHLLDAIGLAGRNGTREPLLPVAWSGVRIDTSDATALRARMTFGEDTFGLEAFDEDGVSRVSVDSVVGRPVSARQLAPAGAAPGRPLALDWVRVQRTSPAGEVAAVEAISLAELLGERSDDLAEAAHAATRTVLELVKERAAGVEGSRTVLLTEGALTVAPGDSADPASAAVWGLMRSAMGEHPGRFALIDSDSSEASRRALSGALAASATEGQLALREGELTAPRVVHRAAPPGSSGEPAEAIDPERTVLITGATGGLGKLLARHLVEGHGARHLLLLSRSGPKAEGAAELRAELEELGATVGIVACDVGERSRSPG